MRYSLAVASLMCAAIVELGCSNVQSLTAPSPIAHATATAATQAIVVSLTSWVMSGWIGPRGRVEVMTVRDPGQRGRW